MKRVWGQVGKEFGWVLLWVMIVGYSVCPKFRIRSDLRQDFSERPSDTFLALIGEGRGQGAEEMTALGEAIRNRGTLSGVYGYSVGQRMLIAWERSKTSDLTHGATEWRSDRDWERMGLLERLKFEKEFVMTAHIGQTRFYKKRERR